MLRVPEGGGDVLEVESARSSVTIRSTQGSVAVRDNSGGGDDDGGGAKEKRREGVEEKRKRQASK